MKMDNGCFEFHTMQINMSIFSLLASTRAVVITWKSLLYFIYCLCSINYNLLLGPFPCQSLIVQVSNICLSRIQQVSTLFHWQQTFKSLYTQNNFLQSPQSEIQQFFFECPGLVVESEMKGKIFKRGNTCTTLEIVARFESCFERANVEK